MKNPLIVVGFAVSLVLAGDTAKESPLKDSPLAEYGVAGVENERLSGGLAGLIGVGATAAVSFAIFYGLRRFNKTKL